MGKAGSARLIGLIVVALIILSAGAGFSSPEKSDQEAQRDELIQKFRAIFDLRDISDTEKLSKILGIKMKIETEGPIDKFSKQDLSATIWWVDYLLNHNNRVRTTENGHIRLHVNQKFLCIQRSDIEGEFGKEYTQFYGIIADCCTIDGLRYEDKENGDIRLTREFEFRDRKCLENFSVYQVVWWQ